MSLASGSFIYGYCLYGIETKDYIKYICNFLISRSVLCNTCVTVGYSSIMVELLVLDFQIA